jgi:tetratricopeptide (TPR) repeat protein
MSKTADLPSKRRWIRGRWAVVGLLLLLVVAGPLFLYRDRIRSTRHLGEAERALNAGDPAAALEPLEQALRLVPDSAKAEYLLAVAHRRCDDLATFALHCDRAAERGWPEKELQRQRDLAAAQQGSVGDAVQRLMAVIEEGVSDAQAEEIYEALSKGHLASYRLQDAWMSLDFWLQWKPNAPQARLMRAEINQRMGEVTSAIADYRAVLSQIPNHREASRKLGELLLLNRRVEEARDCFRDCLKHWPDEPDTLLGLARCEQELGSSDEAQRCLDLVLEQDLSQGQRALALAEQGKLQLAEGRVEEGIESLLRAVELSPAEVSTRFALQKALFAAGREDEANRESEGLAETERELERISMITAQVVDAPADADLMCEAAYRLVRLGYTKESGGWLACALRANPNHSKSIQLARAGSSFQNGLEAVRRNDWKAVQAAAQSLRAVDGYERHLALLEGILLKRDGRFSEALALLGHARRHPDTVAMAYRHSGEILYQTKQLGPAQRVLSAALTLDPDATDARRFLAATYFDTGAMDDAVKELETIVRQTPDDSRPHRLLALIYKDYENYAEAIEEYQISLELDPNQPDRQSLLVDLAESQLALRRFQEAAKTLDQCQPSARVLTAQAECCREEGHPAQAERLAREALGLESGHSNALQLLATLAKEAGDMESSVEYLTKAVDANPRDFRLRYKLGQAYQQLGRLDLAEKHLAVMGELRSLRRRFTDLHTEAITRPGDVEVRYQLGVVASQLGMPDIARHWFVVVLGMSPDHTGAREALASLEAERAVQNPSQRVEGPDSTGRMEDAVAPGVPVEPPAAEPDASGLSLPTNRRQCSLSIDGHLWSFPAAGGIRPVVYGG